MKKPRVIPKLAGQGTHLSPERLTKVLNGGNWSSCMHSATEFLKCRPRRGRRVMHIATIPSEIPRRLEVTHEDRRPDHHGREDDCRQNNYLAAAGFLR